MKQLVYPRFQAEMERKKLNVKQTVDRAGLNYPAICPKLTQRGGLKFTEARALKKAINSRLSLELLFESEIE